MFSNDFIIFWIQEQTLNATRFFTILTSGDFTHPSPRNFTLGVAIKITKNNNLKKAHS